jgi:ubiquinone/menaquinone biosynthesis C-methylase UbiE
MTFKYFICPFTKSNLKLNNKKKFLINKSDNKFYIKNNLVNFLKLKKLDLDEKQIKKDYDNFSENYDKWINWMFKSFRENEKKTRNKIINKLKIKKNFKILEIGCGTGRDTIFLEKKIGSKGKLFVQDISEKMINILLKKFKNNKKIIPFVSNSDQLPFKENFFDVIYNFGSFNEFLNPRKVLLEFNRVLKKDGKVLIGDENIAPWLKETTYAKIIENNNNIFERDFIPLKYLPDNSEDVNLSWEIGKCFYIITYKKGKNGPILDLDLKHDSLRGGSLRTRYYGKIEGVDPELKEKFYKCVRKNKNNVSSILESLITKYIKE